MQWTCDRESYDKWNFMSKSCACNTWWKHADMMQYHRPIEFSEMSASGMPGYVGYTGCEEKYVFG